LIWSDSGESGICLRCFCEVRRKGTNEGKRGLLINSGRSTWLAASKKSLVLVLQRGEGALVLGNICISKSHYSFQQNRRSVVIESRITAEGKKSFSGPVVSLSFGALCGSKKEATVENVQTSPRNVVATPLPYAIHCWPDQYYRDRRRYRT